MAAVDNYYAQGATTSSPFRYATKLHRRIHSDSQTILHIVKGHARAVMAAASTLASSHSSAKLACGVSAAAVEGYERRDTDQCVWYTIRVYPCTATAREGAPMPIPCKSYSVYRRYEDVVQFAERLEAERPFFKFKHDASCVVRRLLHQSIKFKSNSVPPPWTPVNAFGTEADCMRRKRNLDIYLQELFKLGPAVGQCQLAAEFFGMWKSDFETDLPPALHALVTKPCQVSNRDKARSHSQAQHETVVDTRAFKSSSDLSLSTDSCKSTHQRVSQASTSDTMPPKVSSVSGVPYLKKCGTPSRTPSSRDDMMAESAACFPSPPGSSYHSDEEATDYDEDMDDTTSRDNDPQEYKFSREHMNSPCSSVDSKHDIPNTASTDLRSQTSQQPLWQTYEHEQYGPPIDRRRRNAVQYDRFEGVSVPTPLTCHALRVSQSCSFEKCPCLVSKIHRKNTAPLSPPYHASVSRTIASSHSRCPTPISASWSEPGQSTRPLEVQEAGNLSKTSAGSAHLGHACTGQRMFTPATGHLTSVPERIKCQDRNRPLTRSIKRRKRVSGPRPSPPLRPTASKLPPGILKNWTRAIKETRLACQTSSLPLRRREHGAMNSPSRMTSPTPGAQFLAKYPKAFAAVFKIVVDPERIVALQVMERDEDFMLSVPDLRLRVRQKFARVEMPLPDDFDLVWEPCGGSRVVLKNDEELQKAIHASATHKITLRCIFQTL